MSGNLELLNTALWIMIFGMSIVFIFLIVLIVSITLSHKILKFLKPHEFDEVHEPVSAKTGDKGIIAAVTAAVKMYRNKQ